MTLRAFALNAKTFDITHELPFSSLQVNNVLSGVGSWSMELPVSFTSPAGVEIFTDENLSTNRTLVAIVSDEYGVMLGLLEQESGEYTEDSESFRIGGPEASLGYLDRRAWMSGRTTYTLVDLFTILSDIVFESDFLGFGTLMEITKEPAALAGDLGSLVIDQADRKTLYQLIKDFASTRGVEFMGYVAGSQATGFIPGVKFGYPLLRRTNFVLELGKNIKRLTYTTDGGNYANIVYAAGGKRGQYAPMKSSVYGPDLASTPYFTKITSFPDVLTDTDLQSRADRVLYLSKTPPRRFDIVVDHKDPDCTLGTFRLGDEFRLIAKRGRLNVDSFFRVESWSLSVNVDGSEEVKMNMFETGTM